MTRFDPRTILRILGRNRASDVEPRAEGSHRTAHNAVLRPCLSPSMAKVRSEYENIRARADRCSAESGANGVLENDRRHWLAAPPRPASCRIWRSPNKNATKMKIRCLTAAAITSRMAAFFLARSALAASACFAWRRSSRAAVWPWKSLYRSNYNAVEHTGMQMSRGNGSAAP